MREFVELRIAERFANMLFGPDEGRRIGELVRSVELETNDPKFPRVGELQRELRDSRKSPFFYGWSLRHEYTTEELRVADRFLLGMTATFEPAGELCGTRYDETAGCHNCCSGATQVSDLILSISRIPKRKDIAVTIAGEIVISHAFAEALVSVQASGCSFRPVYDYRLGGSPSPLWRQLVVEHAVGDIVSPTRAGTDPFDVQSSPVCSCSQGGIFGLNLLSELFVSLAPKYQALDFISTRQHIGTRRGLLRPRRLIVLSRKVRELVLSHNLKGFDFEVAHLVRPN